MVGLQGVVQVSSTAALVGYRADKQNRCQSISILALFHHFNMGSIIRKWAHYILPPCPTSTSWDCQRGSAASIESRQLGHLIHGSFGWYSRGRPFRQKATSSFRKFCFHSWNGNRGRSSQSCRASKHYPGQCRYLLHLYVAGWNTPVRELMRQFYSWYSSRSGGPHFKHSIPQRFWPMRIGRKAWHFKAG